MRARLAGAGPAGAAEPGQPDRRIVLILRQLVLPD
jgi:hypothetical protein